MQNEGKLPVCHLCLKSRECTYEYVEALTIEILEFLGLGLHLEQSEKPVKPVICQACSESVQKCVNFKTNCICSEDCINSFRNEKNNVKLDLREIYLSKNDITTTAVSKYHSICRLCMDMVESSNCTPLNNETEDAVSAEAILRRYFAELDLDIIENPHICASCNDSLHSYFSFVKKCLDMKDEIKDCCKIEESDEKYQVESDSELRFGANNLLNYKNAWSDIDILENCDQNDLYNDTGLKIEITVEEESQEWQIEPQVNQHEEIDDVIRDIAENCHKCNIKHEEINVKAEEGDFGGFESNLLIQKNSSEVRMYSCELCTFKTKSSSKLKNHILIHENSSEVTMYSCELCPYKSKHKSNLKLHMLIHKDTSEITMYSCEICTYKSKHKRSLKRHMLVHKDTSEVTMYSCEICTYKAKHKGYLKQHMLVHKDTSQITMYSCEICTYKAKQEGTLEKHMLIHKDSSEITMYSCEICTYQTKQKGHLKQHMLIHKDTSEVAMHSCEICSYKAKQKARLKQHMLIHKDTSEVTMYSCEICAYKTKHKSSIKQHLLIHKDTAEITMYSCEICTYKAVQKGTLKRHMLIHKNTSEVTMYSCELCPYTSKHKSNLKLHTLIHKDTSEITMYACEICMYKSKYKRSLKRHVLIHRIVST